MKQVYLNTKNAAFLYTDLKTSTCLSVCKLNTSQYSWSKFGRNFEIWTKFWTKLVILNGRKMTFWPAYFFSSYIMM